MGVPDRRSRNVFSGADSKCGRWFVRVVLAVFKLHIHCLIKAKQINYIFLHKKNTVKHLTFCKQDYSLSDSIRGR